MKKLNMWFDSVQKPWGFILAFLIASPFIFSQFIPGFEDSLAVRASVGAYVIIVVGIRMWWSLYKACKPL